MLALVAFGLAAGTYTCSVNGKTGTAVITVSPQGAVHERDTGIGPNMAPGTFTQGITPANRNGRGTWDVIANGLHLHFASSASPFTKSTIAFKGPQPGTHTAATSAQVFATETMTILSPQSFVRQWTVTQITTVTHGNSSSTSQSVYTLGPESCSVPTTTSF